MLLDLTPGSAWRTSLERTRRAPIIVKGVEWLSYSTGIARYALIATKHAAMVRTNGTGHTYTSVVGTKTIGKMHRTEHGALEAATDAILRQVTNEPGR